VPVFSGDKTMALQSREIDALEKDLGCRLPPEIRNIYLQSNGLRGPTDCWLLFPAKDDETNDIRRINELKTEDWFPSSLRRFAFIGSDGVGGLVGISDSGEAILWYPNDGASIHEQKESVTEIWDVIRQLYEDTALGE
jgi:hypothetical protein